METIYALSSGVGLAGVAVVRVSGSAAARTLTGLAGPLPPARQAVLRRLRAPGNGEVIDQALVIWFPGPASFTGEDVAEFHIHGGRAVIAALLNALSTMTGLRPAGPGEFTRRAFARGRLDLTAVEGLADLIEADTEQQRRAALRVALGENRRLYEGWRQSIISALALVEASIDFVEEEDVPVESMSTVVGYCQHLVAALTAHLASEGRAKRLRDGVQIVIAGPPNAGKSSLLNWLAQRDVAIVAAEAGTTRDILEVHLDLGGYAVTICDTAGLRDALGDVEREGIRRAEGRIAESDLVLWLSEGGDAPKLSAQTVWPLRSKIDLLERVEAGGISTANGAGLDELLAQLHQFVAELMGGTTDSPMLIRDRHRQAFHAAIGALSRVIGGRATANIEFLAEDLRLAAREIGRVTGVVDVEDILGDIFARFCVGK